MRLDTATDCRSDFLLVCGTLQSPHLLLLTALKCNILELLLDQVSALHLKMLDDTQSASVPIL